MAIVTNALLGAYKILAPLGKGGMGEVYRAKDTRLNREVAVKVLPAEFAQDTNRLRRFEQEAKATSSLNHPNILTVFDFGTHEGNPYIVMELLEGEELRAQLNDGALPVRKAIDYAQQIAGGLAAAHEKGIVHRDLKPENLFVTKDGRVKILDFGLAKLRPSRNASIGSDVATAKQYTNPGTVMGTVAYMSPEQVQGKDLDHRSDIFSFGIVLHEMLSGRRPFGGDSAIEVMNAILKEAPPELTASNPRVPQGLERLVGRCLEKKPERRFHSAHDLGYALEALATPSGARLETPPALPTTNEPISKSHVPRREWLAWAVAAALLLALGLTWAYFTRQPAPDAQMMKLSLLPPEKTSFDHVAVSPDGNWLAFTAATGSNVQLWVRALASAEAKLLEGTEGATFPFWSPDSRFIGFFASGKLKKVEVSGGLPTTLCDTGVATGGTWNREGVILFSFLGGGISRVPATGGAPVNIRRADIKRRETDTHAQFFLPDGRHFLYVVASSDKEVQGVYVGSLNGGVQQRLLGDASNAIYAPSGSGGGYLLFSREEALTAQAFDAEALRLGGEPFTVAGRVGIVQGGATSYRNPNVSASDNGLLVFDPLPERLRRQVRWVDRGGKTINTFAGLNSVGSRRTIDGLR
jgi:eukaryotic-like serine/threonine-protein kinase